MAGDWLKMRHDLADDPSVIRVAADLSIDEDLVIGKLFRLWSWADRHTVEGEADGIGMVWVDRLTRCEGFGAALERAGWLAKTAGGLCFPRFHRHCSDTAKARALASDRMKRSRCARSATEAQPEKRREEAEREKREEHTHTHGGDDFRQPGWAATEWQRFVAAWNVTERAEPWPHLTPPDGWVDLAASPGWLERAREALARLPSRQFFDRPLPVTRFFDFVDRIRAGEFADPKGSTRSRPRQPAGGNL
jgi:hypothetical protein